jgi:serine/threonine protein kinase/tetratricopeptide (TPR) repeat protein
MTIVGPLTPGTHLGAYEVGILLGSGGMGKVYKARDVRLGRPVAIKLLSEALVQDPQARRYVEREAKAISRLNHPHICTLYDIGHHEGLDYLVMEFLAGATVREQLERGPFTPDNVIRHGIQIAEALSEAHRCGLLHGDLKPSNVMITANGAKVLDFGLARPLELPRREHDASSTASVLSRRGAAGTLPYMAPEQLEHQVSDARSDIFSYGALMYEMYSGRRAFTGASEAALVAAILQCTPIRLPVGPGTQALVRTVMKCLAKDPDARWQSFEEIVAVLDAMRMPARRPRSKPAAAPSKANVRSVRRLVVLPFENLSADTLEEYVPDGLTNALSAALSAIRPLRVISWGSPSRLDHRHDLGALARTLGIDAVIRGTVGGDSDRVQVRVELIHAAAGTALWSETYDCPLDDVLRAQGDIAATMAMTLQLTLTPADRKRAPGAAWSNDRAANEAYLRGRYFLDRVTLESLRRSFQHLSNAVQRDPSHGRAYAALAEWYVSAASFHLVARSEALLKAKAAAVQAIRLDPMLAEAHTCLGLIAMLEWDLQRARLEFGEALRINPNSANALRGMARSESWLGLHGEAIDRVDLFRQLDPDSPKTHVAAASVYYAAGDFDKSLAAAREALELEPRSEPAQYFCGMSHHFAGRSREAIALLTEGSRECPALLPGLSFVLAQSGRVDDAHQIIDQMRERATLEEISPYDFAEAFMGFGDVDRVLKYLERGCELRLSEMVGVAVDPVFRSLQDHPRLQRVLRTVGLTADPPAGSDPSRRVP